MDWYWWVIVSMYMLAWANTGLLWWVSGESGPDSFFCGLLWPLITVAGIVTVIVLAVSSRIQRFFVKKS